MFHKCIVLAVFFAFPALGFARDFAAIQKDGTIQFATEGAFKPFNYFEGEKLTGFEIDLANAVVAKMGLQVHWVTKPFDSLLIGLSQDRYDAVIASHGITEERLKAVDFTHPHYCTGGAVVAKAGGPKNSADLNGKVVAVQVGTTYVTGAEKIPGVKKVQTFPKDTDAYQSLVMGRVDAWVSDKFGAMDVLKQHPENHLQLGDLLFQEKVAMAVAKNNASLREKLNLALAQVMKDGTYQALSEKYFGQDIRCR